ncbi:MAG TPA: hypothetical protein VFL94_09770 [Actinomycetales bacterium]|nr:hypothetical protein [Actinomycetales bacterium]
MIGVSAALACAMLAGAAVLVRPPPTRAVGDVVGSVDDGSQSAGATWAGRAVRTRWVRAVHRRRRPSAAAAADEVLDLVGDLAALVRAGASPDHAWTTVVDLRAVRGGCAASPHLGGTASCAREALEHWAAVPDAPSAVDVLRAAWSLSDDVGAPLAELLETVAAGIRYDRQLDTDVAVALAAPRATARLLGLLPVAGLALGQLVGAHPVRVLLQTPVGRLCGLAAVLLALVGQLWTRRLVSLTLAASRA